MLSSESMSGNGEAFRFLANGFLYPEDGDFIDAGWRVLSGLSHDLSLPFDLQMDPPDLIELQAEYIRLFISTPTRQLAPPYASCYLSRSRLLNQEAAQEALNYYREVGVEPKSSTEPPDHIATELAFVAHLIDHGHVTLLSRFLEGHLLKWYPRFFSLLLQLEPPLWYRQLGKVTGALLEKIHQKGGH